MEPNDEKMAAIEAAAAQLVAIAMPLIHEFDSRSATLALEKATKRIKDFCVSNGLPPA